MRLVFCNGNGGFSLTNDLVDRDTIPPYAILSHTWQDNEEVTLDELIEGSNKEKAGYNKIRFCAQQAKRDGLEYFWVDTCCIDRADRAKLREAISSMFRYYGDAARCYVLLSDVPYGKRKVDTEAVEYTWSTAFRTSRWFKRGWTLQELLAPRSVEFFSKEWRRLGDKISLQRRIHEAARIPEAALQGVPLSHFSIDDRLKWSEHRETKIPEDRAYCLIGIFGIQMTPFYDEGADGAFKRLMEEAKALDRCLQDLRLSDPRDDKKRIEDTKGGLLADSYRWILNNPTFQQWQRDLHNQLLWVKGDPGKGKTMLLCGIINELQEAAGNTVTISYFFCQATDSRINSALAALRGLLYMLVIQQPSIASHVCRKYNHAGKALFEDANAWVALTEIFVDMLRDPSLRTTYLIIDALDECVTDLPKLLEFVAKQSSTSDRVKWIVSSRNWPEIEAHLEQAGNKVKLSLELNAKSVAAAVDIFIHQKADQLAQEKQYKAEVRHAVLQHLASNANDTFLWVALVCQDLKATPKWNVLMKLALFPPGLDPLYKRMLHQISKSDGAEICRQVLASNAILYRPATIPELVALIEQLRDFVDDMESVREIISLCGSFLTLRDDTVYFVHQSAKDFLLAKALDEVFPGGTEDVHQAIFSKSLAILSRTLHRDMYALKAPGTPIGNVRPPDKDPLAALRYPCVYWIDHLHDSKPKSSANSVANFQMIAVNDFLRKKYLYWLEGLSLCKSLGQGVVSITKLWLQLQVWHPEIACPYRVDADASRRCGTKINLLSLFKTHGDLLCIIKGQSRVILFKYMHLRCCLVQQVV
ncbi:HET-domain-containing protein [Clathrospora elynae]|uniref:HET-domain-containing protein n=1 Tax=Clathrospora elynae TaxID=706981 RepID=A0A6A5SG71_9PLEO|nr:HET-domain-containing protein [Clathrospora elynae]